MEEELPAAPEDANVVEEDPEDANAVENDLDDELWAEKLVAKARARAPVKREFLNPTPNRSSAGNAAVEAPKISAEKKSKRQIKKERNEAKKTNICPAVAKTGDAKTCTYGGNCRYSHDISGFLSQKEEDLPGDCPSLALKKPCRFGIRCRFYGTHSKIESDGAALENVENEDGVGINVLNKEFQKTLWKNKVKFPKADAQLKALGVMNKLKDKHPPKGDAEAEAEQPTQVAEDDGPPPKKQKTDSEATDETFVEAKLNAREKRKIDFKGKLYLAPLTTVGNLPFRRVCKALGADITCGEMALCSNLLQGQASEWALLRRHPVEDVFGVQICGAHADSLARTAELIERECTVDFVDINIGCPIDIIVNKGAGSCLLTKPTRLEQIVRATSAVLDNPLTLKVRTGYFEGRNCAHTMIPEMSKWGAAAVTIHGRTRQQRYSKLADWKYIYDCAKQAPDELPVIGNGDIFSYTEWNEHVVAEPKLASCLIARGALVKPWIFTEIKEQRHWDISSGERLDYIRDYVRFGLEHWGSDSKGVETTRRFLLEWLSYTHRYIPVGLLEVVPQKLNWRPPSYFGRNDLETLMASDSAADWVRISEMVLGPAPSGFVFTPKHKSNAYDKAENG